MRAEVLDSVPVEGCTQLPVKPDGPLSPMGRTSYDAPYPAKVDYLLCRLHV